MSYVYEDVLKNATEELNGISTTPRLDAELLLMYVLDLDKTALHARLDQEMSQAEKDRFSVFLERRKASEPIAYIIGKKEFYGLDFNVGRNVLVPRPESELLVEKGLEILSKKDSGKLEILDLGTGSGCLAISIACELQNQERDFEVLAVDSSGEALELAVENALNHGVSADIVFLESSWFSELDPEEDKFDLIISNPPYVSTKETNLPKELSYEPKEALFAGNSGMDDIEHLMRLASSFLKPDGVFLCEIGETQRELITKFYNYVNSFIDVPYKSLNFYKDLAGKDRIMELR